MSISSVPLIGFDTETTGIDVNSDRIVTAAVVRRNPDGTDVTWQWMIAPEIPISPAATKVHGITTDYARDHGSRAPATLEAIAATLAEQMTDGGALVAFNATFDVSLLEAELQRYELESLADRLGGRVCPVFDPLVIDRGVDRYRKGKRTLDSICTTYQVQASGFHDALADVRATLDVMGEILVRYPSLEEYEPTSLHDWQANSHREWAVHFNSWLESRGRTPDVETSWL